MNPEALYENVPASSQNGHPETRTSFSVWEKRNSSNATKAPKPDQNFNWYNDEDGARIPSSSNVNREVKGHRFNGRFGSPDMEQEQGGAEDSLSRNVQPVWLWEI